MTKIKEAIVNKLDVLPEVALREVLTFLDELISRSANQNPVNEKVAWKEFIDRTYGSIPDEDFIRHPYIIRKYLRS
jgi:hypothetical protein